MPYSSYDHDKLEAAETMRIERRIYFEAKDREIAPYASLPIAQLLSMRSESAAAEQAIFDDLKERAAAWEEQAGRTLLLDKTLEYVRTPHVQHTANRLCRRVMGGHNIRDFAFKFAVILNLIFG